jgi:hypothetical protein
MMSHTNYQTLINRGRKAGLTTRELYSAMATRPSEGGAEAIPGQLDGNGFVSGYDAQGRLIYRPVGSAHRA